MLNDSGQDLIEYALVVALIAFDNRSYGNVANSINNAFMKIASKLSAAIT